MSTPFTSYTEQRLEYLRHLNELLRSPLCLTSRSLLPEFPGQTLLNVMTVETFHSNSDQDYRGALPVPPGRSDLATLLLTSGSTGSAKAVCLTHEQILASIAGKSQFHETNHVTTFLNWIDADHVACLVEAHLHAMYLGTNQVHVQLDDLLPDPLLFLKLLGKHQVALIFAPNFFLAKLGKPSWMLRKVPQSPRRWRA